MKDKSYDAIFASFQDKAERASAEVYRLSGWSEVNHKITEIVQQIGGNKIVICPKTTPYRKVLQENLLQAGLSVCSDLDTLRDAAEQADLGISGVEFAVAETGSVCQLATSIESRLVSTLAGAHLVLLDSQAVVESVAQAFDKIAARFDSGYISWITGPSRTADIERVLTIGVHGPSRFIILFVDGLNAEMNGGQLA